MPRSLDQLALRRDCAGGAPTTGTALTEPNAPSGLLAASPSGDIPARWRNQRYGHLIARASRTPVILANRKNGRLALQRMDNVGIVVESLDAAVSFFPELGLELEGRAMI